MTFCILRQISRVRQTMITALNLFDDTLILLQDLTLPVDVTKCTLTRPMREQCQFHR